MRIPSGQEGTKNDKALDKDFFPHSQTILNYNPV
uniref:Uncharacterized protein n=1 Tax=Anguilla anguilla TaxID=7936 RepID=A0A0E9V0G3_ANGAN